jgi:hypothetical protein
MEWPPLRTAEVRFRGADVLELPRIGCDRLIGDGHGVPCPYGWWFGYSLRVEWLPSSKILYFEAVSP